MNKITLGFFQAKSKTTIKGLLTLFVFLVLNSQASWGQSYFNMSSGNYSESFTAWSGYSTNWNGQAVLGIGSIPSATKTTTATNGTLSVVGSGGAIGYDVASSTKLVFLSTGATDNTAAVACDLNLNFSGRIAGNLSFDYALIFNTAQTFGRAASLVVYYSVDGTTWASLTSYTVYNTTGSSTSAIPINIALPSVFNNQPTCKLRFYEHNGGTVIGTPSGSRPKISVDNVAVTSTAPTATTWDGTTWSYGTPSTTVEAIIDGTYITKPVIEGGNGTFIAKKLTVNSGKSLTINSGTNVTVQNEIINNGTLVVENNANLNQDPAATVNTNVGDITVKRDSNPLFRQDYTMWSSPVVGQNLLGFSPITSNILPNNVRFYTFDGSLGTVGQYVAVNPGANSFTTGTGYLIRMPNTDPTTNYDAGTATLVYNGTFTGVPNNGDVSLTVASGTYNAVGNPYPSTINADSFISGNALTEALYFWRKTNNVNQATAPTTSYATYTLAGGAGTAPGSSSITPNGFIQVGQGFIAKSTSTTLKFTNSMRTANNSNQILKTKAVERNRVWVNLTSAEGAFNQMMVAYMTGATQGIDSAIDGRYFNDSPTALNSLVNNEEFAIQGRGLPFDGTDTVALAFKTDKAGDFSIAIDHVDGLFAAGQDIYLVDSKNGTETNLKNGGYNFTATAGVDNTRFSLKYQKTLKVADSAMNVNTVIVYKNKETLYVNSSAKAISSIKVYDVQGRLLEERNNVKANTATITNLKASNQILIVEVRGEDNFEVTKKVAN